MVGSTAITHPEKVKESLVEFGNERIVVAFDIRIENEIPKLALHGWQTKTDKNLWQILDEYKGSALRHVLCTDISRDGTLSGPNVALYKECVKRYPAIEFQASGGISTLNDLSALSSIGISSAIVGKAFYEKKFSLQDALNGVEVC